MELMDSLRRETFKVGIAVTLLETWLLSKFQTAQNEQGALVRQYPEVCLTEILDEPLGACCLVVK
jgi:hypothetical protein